MSKQRNIFGYSSTKCVSLLHFQTKRRCHICCSQNDSRVDAGLDPASIELVARGAFDAAWDVIARSLANTTLIIVLGALVVAAGGFVVDLILTRRPAT